MSESKPAGGADQRPLADLILERAAAKLQTPEGRAKLARELQSVVNVISPRHCPIEHAIAETEAALGTATDHVKFLRRRVIGRLRG